MNLHRRQLTASQRAVIALEILPQLEAEAAERLKAGRILGGQRRHTARASGDRPAKVKRPSANEAAKMLGIGEASVRRAKAVQRDAPELLDDVRQGRLSIGAAAKKARRPKTTTPPNL
jgi:hypothetical protein